MGLGTRCAGVFLRLGGGGLLLIVVLKGHSAAGYDVCGKRQIEAFDRSKVALAHLEPGREPALTNAATSALRCYVVSGIEFHNAAPFGVVVATTTTLNIPC